MRPGFVASQLSKTKDFARIIEQNVNTIPGIESVANGKIEVSEDSIEVEKKGSSKSAKRKEIEKSDTTFLFESMVVLAFSLILCMCAAAFFIKARADRNGKGVELTGTDSHGTTVAIGRPIEQNTIAQGSLPVVDGTVMTAEKASSNDKPKKDAPSFVVLTIKDVE
jgi:hypothetical protein